MIPILGNAAGLWALLGIPAVLAIHFLQQRARVARTSTWFLIEKLAPDSARGRTWDRLRSSRSLWLQLLAVLIATWVLVEPRWVRAESAQTVVIVLDASASMEAFRAGAIEAGERELAAAAGLAARTTWVVMTTNSRQPPLYRGLDRAAAAAALREWRAELGQHDVGPALRLARGLAGPAGRSLLITDSKGKPPPDQRAVGVGFQIDNVGFAGASVTRVERGYSWRALIQNHSATTQRRTWHIESGAATTAEQTVELAPGAITEISADWPASAERATIVLSADGFAADDRLPLIRPEPKPLTVSVDGEDEAAGFFRKVARSIDGVTLVAGVMSSTLRVARADQSEAFAEKRGGIFWPPADQRPQVQLMTDPVIAERDPLVAGLNWQGWIGSGPDGYASLPGDRPLLWQNRFPLAFVRPANEGDAKTPSHGRKLFLAFDWATSNAARLPATVLLTERFIIEEREAQRAPYAANFDDGELVPLAASIPGGELTLEFQAATGAPPERRTVTVAERTELRAPGRPGFFTVKLGDELLVKGAAHFPDPRQGDFHAAASFTTDVPADRKSAIERNTESDPYAPGWLVLLGIVVLGSWWRRSSRTATASSPVSQAARDETEEVAL